MFRVDFSIRLPFTGYPDFGENKLTLARIPTKKKKKELKLQKVAES